MREQSKTAPLLPGTWSRQVQELVCDLPTSIPGVPLLSIYGEPVLYRHFFTCHMGSGMLVPCPWMPCRDR